MLGGYFGGRGGVKRRIRRCLGQIICGTERVRVQQNWVAARGLMSMMGDKTRLENIKG